jgi:hypothetical protein
MWSATPSPEQLAIPDITHLKNALQKEHFKSNESFLGWQWTSLHPRRKDFLLRYAKQPESIHEEILKALQPLLINLNQDITRANAVLQHASHGLSASLSQLRAELFD